MAPRVRRLPSTAVGFASREVSDLSGRVSDPPTPVIAISVSTNAPRAHDQAALAFAPSAGGPTSPIDSTSTSGTISLYPSTTMLGRWGWTICRTTARTCGDAMTTGLFPFHSDD